MSTASLDLRSPVQFLKGVGTQRAEILERIGIHKASDLLFYFPRDYQDMTERREIEQLLEEEQRYRNRAVISLRDIFEHCSTDI